MSYDTSVRSNSFLSHRNIFFKFIKTKIEKSNPGFVFWMFELQADGPGLYWYGVACAESSLELDYIGEDTDDLNQIHFFDAKS